MGSNGESQDKGIDATVGGLVWVRRRNGSWWPGQIIDADECAESLMASPRSGTPIKLLGREDVSVDWYNLEKSKRVKPFRCGEYDVCIEKAKRVAANSARKAVKYARRDDAILQALEIEMEQQSRDPVKSSPTVSLSIEGTEHTDEKFSSLEGNNSSVANQVLGSSVKQSVQARPRRTPNDSEDDGAEGVKRMRGLDDLGMGPIPAMKRKRTLVGHVHEFLKKKNRSRPLTKVLESSTKGPFVRIRAVRNGLGLNESNRSSSIVINNSDSVGVSCENRNRGKASGHSLESVLVSCKPKEKEISDISARLEKASAEKLVDLPSLPKRTRPAGTVPTGTTPIVSCQKLWGGAGRQSSQSSQVETVSLGNEESVSTSSGAADVDSFSLGIENRNSRWQSKGKRNSRNIRSKKRDLRKISSVNDDVNDNLDEYWGRCGRTSSKVSLPWGLTADTKLFTDSSPSAPRSLPFRQSRSVMNPKYGPEFSMINHDDSDTELFDVHLEVKASSRGQHVPYISLMSKLTGRPIVGHPLTAEVLEEGSTDNLVRDAKWDLSNSNFEINFFVSEDERKSRVGGARVPPKHLKFHRVSPLKSTKLRKSSPSKKIRKLSSLTGFSKLREGERNIVVEKIVAPALACVPLKVAYSRINAALRGVMRPPRRVVVKPRRR